MTGFSRFIPRRRARLIGVSLAVMLATTAFAYLAATETRVGRELEFQTIDARFQQRGPRPVPDDILILAIDNNTDGRLGKAYPYPRSYHADVITRLKAAGARAIVFDIQFLEPDRVDPANDIALYEAAADAGNVSLATAEETDNRGARSTPMPFRSVKLPATGDPLAAAGIIVGHSKPERASDNVHRWLSPFADVRVDPTQQDVYGTTRRLPALSLSALAIAEGKAPFEYEQRVPQRFALNYYGPTGTHPASRTFRYRNYADVLEPGADLGWARGKTVLVGYTGAVFQDLHEVPFRVPGADEQDASLMPGVEIHATALQNMRAKEWLVERDARSAQVAVLLLAAASWMALVLLPLRFGLFAAIAVEAAYVAYAYRQFLENEVVALIPTVGASSAGLMATVALLAVNALGERRRVAGLFSRYVSPDVVRELVELGDGEDVEVGGVRREITVLFSDIRGFTSISETMEPEELVSQLNEYFDEMTAALDLERGTLDKFMGDGMMAFFGAPIPQDDHADRACAAALEMVERLAELNGRRADDGLPPLAIGIGIHTGEAIVGNIGSTIRQVGYTAIGDTVNLASRLESNTKELGVQILVSKATVDAATGHCFVPRGQIVVKGRTQATDVFELTGKEVGEDEQHTSDTTARPGPAAGSAPPGQAA